MDIDDDHDVNPPFFPPKTTNGFNNQIILTVIISLLFVVVLVLLLFVYARCVLRRQASRRAGIIRQLALAAQVQSTEPPKTGLDPSVIAALPEFVYKQQDDTPDDLGTIECAVCLSVLVDGEIARLLPNCKHTFHAECIDKWLSSQPTCPICRTEAEPLLMLEPPTGNPPTAPPLEHVNSAFTSMEGTSDGALQLSAKVSGSNSRLSSFRRMLSRERSSRRTQSSGQDDGVQDLERQ